MNKQLVQSLLLIVVGIVVLTTSYLRYCDLQLRAGNANGTFNECRRIVGRLNEIKDRIPEKMVASDSLQPAKMTLDIFAQSQIAFEGEPFATEMPAVSLGNGSLQTVNISIPKARMKMAEIVELLQQIDSGRDPLFVSDVVLERIPNSGNDPTELWRTGLNLFVVKRASK